MREYWSIRTTAVEPGMQVKSEGLWWQVERIMDDGSNTGTMTLMARRVASTGLPTAGRPRLIWLPITNYGATVRPGAVDATEVQVNGYTRRVVHQPRQHRDPMPYVDGHGDRHRRHDTAAYRRIVELAQQFRTGAAS